MAGDPLPDWVIDVSSVEMERLAGRFDDSQANVLAALEKVDGWAYIMHDDMVMTRPVQVILPAHRGALSLYTNRGDYYMRARTVASWLRRHGFEIWNYNVHAPFLVHAGRYLECAELVAQLPAGFRASVYGNVVHLRTRRIYDPKVTGPGQHPYPGWPVWSMSDRSFKQGVVGKKVRALYPTASVYER